MIKPSQSSNGETFGSKNQKKKHSSSHSKDLYRLPKEEILILNNAIKEIAKNSFVRAGKNSMPTPSGSIITEVDSTDLEIEDLQVIAQAMEETARGLGDMTQALVVLLSYKATRTVARDLLKSLALFARRVEKQSNQL